VSFHGSCGSFKARDEGQFTDDPATGCGSTATAPLTAKHERWLAQQHDLLRALSCAGVYGSNEDATVRFNRHRRRAYMMIWDAIRGNGV
jgi:hypothetical protein